MQANQLQTALKNLAEAIRETESVLETLRAQHDPLASHIFVSRRQYQNMPDTKGGKRHERVATLSWRTACELGYRGTCRMGTADGGKCTAVAEPPSHECGLDILTSPLPESRTSA